jgi:hypothetical protein
MTNRSSSGRVDRPQAVVGPITLAVARDGSDFTIPPNSVVGPAALCAALGASAIGLIDATSTGSGITVSVTCDGTPQTIDINGQGGDGQTVSFTTGSTLFAIARTNDQIVLQSENANGSESSSVTFPIGTGTVTVTLSVTRGI